MVRCTICACVISAEAFDSFKPREFNKHHCRMLVLNQSDRTLFLQIFPFWATFQRFQYFIEWTGMFTVLLGMMGEKKSLWQE